MHRRSRRWYTCTLLLFAPAAAFAALDHPERLPFREARYACRYAIERTPPTVSELPSHLARGTGTLFAPEIQTIVDAMAVNAFDTHVGDLSGANAVVIGGSPHTFTTRHSLSSQAALSWQYALEALGAMGWTVSYHDYVRSGNALKNVVATRTGVTTPDQIYVIGGHIDSTSPSPQSLAPGAEDNGTGSAGILTAAAALSLFDYDSTIELVLFSGEEQGLWGSQAYVNDAVSAGRDIRAAVTFDMIGYHDNDYGVLIEGEAAWLTLMTVMGDAVDAYTDLSREFSFFSFGSDHIPFQDAGIPAILVIDLDWDSYPGYHRTTDVYANVDPVFGAKIARAGTATIAHLAGVGSAVAVGGGGVSPAPLVVRPNPASAFATLDLAPRGDVRIYDVAGRAIRRLGRREATNGSITWDLRASDGRRVGPGVYWVTSGARTARLVVVD